jgi:hypothetical protein
MNRLVLLSNILFICAALQAQYDSQLSSMDWKLDSEILLQLEDDSTYSFDIRQLFHVTDASNDMFNTEFIYYPVNMNETFIDDVNEHTTAGNQTSEKTTKTLWSALHETLGGGWIHFTNCLLYALETEQLSLTAPLMKRPESNWKPNPMTESYKRTRKWEYYAPVSQSLAQKEFKIRQQQNELGDVKNLPESFVKLFLNTSDKEYESLKVNNEVHQLAKIDLVKLLLGSNFLGEAQISYISSSVLQSVSTYSRRKVPSVVIFDEYDAAVAMTLDSEGYKIQRIVFREGASITTEAAEQRTDAIEKVIAKINEYNNKAFEKRLEGYYGTK